MIAIMILSNIYAIYFKKKTTPIHALYSYECFMKNAHDFEISNPMEINDFHIQLLSKRYIFTLLHVEDIFQGLVWK